MRVPRTLRRGKLYWGRRPHPAFYRGRRVHAAYYRTIIPRRPGSLLKSGFRDRFGSRLLSELGVCFVTVPASLNPVGTWTFGGLYDHQVPYVEPMWVKWARKAEGKQDESKVP